MEIFDGDWDEMERAVSACGRCALCKTRTQPALDEGDRHAAIMLVGEGPGREEDRLGRPFVGPAGQLLDRMLAAVDLRRDEVYITNIVKCRPPGNRNPEDAEAQACLPFLRRQFMLVQPKIIVCLGAVAARHVYDPMARITRDRGKWAVKNGIHILPTYHPAALLRDEQKKRDAWKDFQSLREVYQQLT